MRSGRGPCVAAARLAATLVIAVAASLVGACDHRISGPSLVLRLATPDRPTDATGIQVQHFADEVALRSGGTIRIDPVWDVTPGGELGWDQIVARGVASGTWDMGLVPGRAWDLLGDTRLRALTTPFLVTSTAALRTVLDSELRDDLLAGLPAAGVVGLDLFPDELRHPFGNRRPLLGPHDYRGRLIRAPRSDTVARVFAALGARVTDADPDSAAQRGSESAYSLTQSPIATGNVTFFAKTDALVMRASVRERLRDDQWSLLRDAAAATREWLFAQEPTDLQQAVEFCSHGGSIVAATSTQVAALEAATAPVTDWLRRDPDTRHLIDAIRSRIADLPAPTPVTRCPGTRTTGDRAELRSIDGRYAARVTKGELRSAGVSNPAQIRENSGRYTWTLSDGTWSMHQVARHFLSNPVDSGTYTYQHGRFTLHWEPGPRQWTRATLRVARDGTIRFQRIRDAQAGNQALAEGTFGEPWFRIGS